MNRPRRGTRRSSGAVLLTLTLTATLGGCAEAQLEPSPSADDRPSAMPSASERAPTSSGTDSARPMPSIEPSPRALTPSALAGLIEPETLRHHLEAFQAIADGAGGTRATGTAGFDASVEHVAASLESSGYVVTREPVATSSAQSTNLFADRPGTGPDVIVLGAHLDSVMVGPGLNDNATGVAALLAIADVLVELAPPHATVRFAFWGAEEGGPFGSASYVAGLGPDELDAVTAYLNFDMLGSPNGVTFVYAEPGAADGSAALTSVVAAPFERRGLAWEPIDLSGDSDHGAFTAASIPTGGLFAGGRELVTDAQAARHGAMAGQPADPCSHKACDTIDNVDVDRLLVMTESIAEIVATLAATAAS